MSSGATTTSSHVQSLSSTSFLTLQVRNLNLNSRGQKILDKNTKKLSGCQSLSIQPSSLQQVCLFYSECLLWSGAHVVSFSHHWREAHTADTLQGGNHTQTSSRGLERENSDAKGTQSYGYCLYHPTTCHKLFKDGVFVMNKTSMLIQICVFLLRDQKP